MLLAFWQGNAEHVVQAPVGPVGPVSPFSPVEPVFPVLPVWPVGPVEPRAPARSTCLNLKKTLGDHMNFKCKESSLFILICQSCALGGPHLPIYLINSIVGQP